MSNDKKESRRKSRLATLDPIWEAGEYEVVEYNEDSENLSDSLGIPDERQLKLRVIASKSMLLHNNVHQPMIEVSEECCHPNELAYACYVIGSEATMLKHAAGYRKYLEKQIKLMEAKLNGEEVPQGASEDDDEELVFPEEPEKVEEELTFDD